MEYDLVTLDLNLPKLDGVSVLRHLRSKKPSLPLLVLTQRTRVEDHPSKTWRASGVPAPSTESSCSRWCCRSSCIYSSCRFWS